MLRRNGLVLAACLGLSIALLSQGSGGAQQNAAPAAQAPAEEPKEGFVPGAVHAPIDPAVVARGKTLYGINCQGCHGPDLRGGDMGGPNLLRSPVALRDQNGEGIVPIVQGARQAMGMPKIGLSIEDSNTVAAYVRSVIATIGGAGVPPQSHEPATIVTGDPAAGEAYFNLKCSNCHSPTGDLAGIASRVSSPKTLQNLWVAGRPLGGPRPPKAKKTVTVTVSPAEVVQGQLLHLDDFLVTLQSPDGSSRSFRRIGDQPRVVVHDPLQAHEDLLPVYTDKQIHDVTAWLVTLK